MEALTRSSPKVFSDKERSFSTHGVTLTRPIRGLLWNPMNDTVRISPSLSHRHRRICPFLVFSLSSSDSQNEETPVQDVYGSCASDSLRTVRVEFQLQRECSFGERFHIVGGDAVLGSWDPLSSIPMEWSEGHVWTVGLDIPIGKIIQFKFILRGGAQKILWQPGPDRVLQTCETNNKITVCEDWNDAHLQKIVEEEPTSIHQPSATSPETLIIAENLILINGDNESTATYAVADSIDNLLTEEPKATVAENITELGENPRVYIKRAEEEPVGLSEKNVDPMELSVEGNGKPVTSKNLPGRRDEGNLDSYEGEPVLVPGLTPLPTASTKVPEEDNVAANSSFEINTAEELKVPEPDVINETGHGSHSSEEPTELMINNEGELNVGLARRPRSAGEKEEAYSEPFGENILENDFVWGRKTLQKLLTGLGFL